MNAPQYLLADLVIHKLIKSEDAPARVELRPTACAPSDAAARLVSTVCELYHGRGSKGYGRFGDADTDAGLYPFGSQLQAYVVERGLDFSSFSQQLMQRLEGCFDEDSGEASGYVLVARMQEGTFDTLWVALLGERQGSAISGALDIVDNVHLDLTSLRAAARVDLAGWQRGDERYLSFLKGRGDVAPWFKRFLGCGDVVVAAKETKKLVRVLNDFAETQRLEAPARDALMERAHGYLDELGENGEPLELDTLAREICPEQPAPLDAVLASEAVKIADGFVPDRRAIKPLVRFKASADQWKLEFDRSGLRSGAVHYDRASGTLVLADLPDYLKKMLDEA